LIEFPNHYLCTVGFKFIVQGKTKWRRWEALA